VAGRSVSFGTQFAFRSRQSGRDLFSGRPEANDVIAAARDEELA
jgi:hypothetical protein